MTQSERDDLFKDAQSNIDLVRDFDNFLNKVKEKEIITITENVTKILSLEEVKNLII